MTRTPTAVDRLADTHVDELVALDPILATHMGVGGHDHELPDLSPDGHAARSEQRRSVLAALDAVEPVDANDRITVAALREELELAEALRASGAEESKLGNVATPVQDLRDVFDQMPTNNADDWSVIATRLALVPAAMDGYLASLRFAAARGDVSPVRQVEACIVQASRNVGAEGFFAQLATDQSADVQRGARAASEAFATLADFLKNELLPQAPQRDAVGRDRYALHSRANLGAVVDLEETYEWGQHEVGRIAAHMRETANRILPGAPLPEVMAHLDADPARKLTSRAALVGWMQSTSDAAVQALGSTHFDIPEPVRTLECRIAPSGTGVIYYTGPNEDFSRPGRMWWDVPDGVDEFSTWRELTTVYHEGVPGHHLQIGQTIFRSELLNRWRRMISWISGHGEGWALYAELLMADLGYLDDPADLLGMLDGQSMRAARVVLDIGIHCGFDAPAEVGGGAWDYEKAWTFFEAHTAMGESMRRFELERYLGWPGQAPSYKVGERLWLQLREDAQRREGSAFDLKAFHRRALDIGSVGLDVLRTAVLT